MAKIREYRIRSLLGEGGMGKVYLAEDEILGRNVAIKVLSRNLASNKEFIERFKQEARAQANLHHPNIVTLYSYFIEKNNHCIVMEFARGRTLRQILDSEGKLTTEASLKIIKSVLKGLSHAHQFGVIHRDIKPSNIIISDQGKVKIMDFGIAKILGDRALTKTGLKMGTLYYMSPEQIRAEKDIDQRADIYALGITMFEMLTGIIPFSKNTESDFLIMQEIVSGKIDFGLLSKNGINGKTSEAIRKMTETDKANRPPTCLQVEKVIFRSTHPSSAGFVFVQGGTFQMGSNNGEDDEKPVHSVTFSDFYISKYEVTQGLWKSVMGNNPSNFKGNDNLPVENVSWYDAIEFCNKLSEKEGLEKVYSGSGDNITMNMNANGYRLPTEAEWEYAARGGSQSKGYEYSGSNNAGDIGLYDANSGGRTHPVGQKQANELGIYDMSGNVWEWCWDWYGDYRSSSQTNPTGTLSGGDRVCRGGSWDSDAGALRTAYRDYDYPGLRSSNQGFRVVRTK